jgi:TolB-like protein/predicted Ser/Thr protein kinase
LIGDIISHYKILEKLGEGGMGVVYKAQDTKLDRIVALKFLPRHLLRDEEAKNRFVNEAKSASALNHSNITTIYEIDEMEGECFISMEYVEGKSLKGLIKNKQTQKWDIAKIIDVSVQIAEGLSGAHQKGIVHRDIKSDNIMLTHEGVVKIMDFGLAKLAGGVQLAKAGTTMGTAAYMSPEQASGKEVDHRTDIWSLGVVLYEMITGQLPFKGEYEEAILYSILNEEPEPIMSLRGEVPTELKQIVDKAFVKNLNSRYQNAREILGDLKKLKKELKFGKEGPFAKRSQPSIAVLPFVNLSADKEQEYFCDGMAEEIINALTHVEDLRVVARTSAFSFRGKEIDIREIGRKLNVETLLEGSVRKAGSRVRITAQLINVTDGYHLWSERYDRDIGALCCPEDIFAIQDDISLTIVDKLKVKLLKGEKTKLVKRHTEDLDAYNLYLKGRYFWNRRTEESLKKSIDCFNQAIEKDPGYALAYAGLADSYVTLQDYSSLSPKVTLPKAKQAAYKALEIDGTLAEARNSLAQVLFREWDWQGAEKEHKRAIELNPNYASAHHWYALVLAYAARFDEAIAEMKRAWELDPLSLIINRNLGLVLCYAHRYDKAIKQLQKTLEMDPSFSLAHASLGLVYLRKAMYQEALTELQKESDIRGGADAVVET